ncbi:enhancer of rudimentary homolog [Drosophila obscura]|uniref:enhancer of rudimentary homolog n=1 Tax=Drosophila obscura TaxID=7282 RepID=UPI000BA07634|nr:enhancer of rudimentary homolog [Drosophila obscura]
MSRTILLIQLDGREKSRSYAYFQSVDDCVERVCKIYEEHLKRCTPIARVITYDIIQLFDFIDVLKDLTCLVYQEDAKAYTPCNKEWIKSQISEKLTKAANKSSEATAKLQQGVAPSKDNGETATTNENRIIIER